MRHNLVTTLRIGNNDYVVYKCIIIFKKVKTMLHICDSNKDLNDSFHLTIYLNLLYKNKDVNKQQTNNSAGKQLCLGDERFLFKHFETY